MRTQLILLQNETELIRKKSLECTFLKPTRGSDIMSESSSSAHSCSDLIAQNYYAISKL